MEPERINFLSRMDPELLELFVFPRFSVWDLRRLKLVDKKTRRLVLAHLKSSRYFNQLPAVELECREDLLKTVFFLQSKLIKESETSSRDSLEKSLLSIQREVRRAFFSAQEASGPKGEIEQWKKSCASLLALPSEIGRMKNLTFLYLPNNLLTTLPKEIGLLEQLRDLWLANNRIRRLPEEFCTLKKLTVLDLEGNELSELPEGFTKLSSLKHLNLHCNRFGSLPKALYRLRSLTILRISHSLPYSAQKLERLPDLKLLRNRF